MNRFNNILPCFAAIVLTLAVTTGCSKNSIGPSDNLADGLNPSSGTPIAFETEELFSKAEIVDDETLKSSGFGVWCWYEGGTSGLMFDGTEVTHNGTEWTYNPVRYWLNGTYNFFAAYPSTLLVNHTGSDFTFSYDVANQVDVVAAYTGNIDGGNHPDAVALNFKHLLCQLEFAAKSNATDMQAILYGIDIVGAVKTATYSASTDTWTNPTVSSDIVYTVKGNDNLNGVDYTTLETGIMMIPQGVGGVDLIVRYYGADANGTLSPQERTYNIPTSEVAIWEKGKKYKYLLSVEENGQITFAAPTVTEWTTASGGSFIINTPTPAQ